MTVSGPGRSPRVDLVTLVVDDYDRAIRWFTDVLGFALHQDELATTTDGRATLIMPHPERVFRTVTNSWHPPGWGEDGPWMRMFRNARAWVG